VTAELTRARERWLLLVLGSVQFSSILGRLTDLHGRRRVFALVAGLSILAGLASLAASAIVARGPGGELPHFGAVGWLSMVATFAAIALAGHVRPAAT
jgi:MFS family permease